MENKIICPICQSLEVDKYGVKNSFNLYSCQDCNLLFVWPIPADLKQIYSQNYFINVSGNKNFGYTDYDRDKEPMRDVFFKLINRFENEVVGRKIFDVGAATGYFLDLAKQRLWQTAGTEISEYAAKVACQREHRIFCLELDALSLDEKFDVITMWDVLEHVSKPLAYLNKANELLTVDGLLAINTVDRGSFFARLLGLKWHLIVPPEHLFFYSLKNLKIILDQAGFEIIEVSKIGKKFSLSYIFKTLHAWQGLMLWQSLAVFFDRSFWRAFALHINLRDNIFILAKKKKL